MADNEVQTPPADNTAPADNTPPVEVDDAQEWVEIAEEFAEESDVELKPKDDDDNKNEEEAGEKSEEKEDKEGEEEEKADGEKKDPEEDPNKEKKDPEKEEEGEEKPKETEETPPPVQDPARDARSVQRQIEADEEAMKEDIREKMFSDTPTELTDADGDPIRTIEDVMKLQNPNTQKSFTQEEAAIWLLQAQNHVEKNQKDVEGQVEKIARANLSLKDESDAVNSKYGELLKSMPDLRAKVWEEYRKTLVTDEKTGVIKEAPVSLEAFYDTALAGYMKLAEQLENQAEKNNKEDEVDKLKKKEEKKKDHGDREDIYSNGGTNSMDPEEKEWAEAAKELYE